MPKKAIRTGYALRRATPADKSILALHRRRMFEDMGYGDDPLMGPMERRSRRWFEELIGRGKCSAWIAEIDNAPIASIAVLLLDWPPTLDRCGPTS